jgi:hypothetical protein
MREIQLWLKAIPPWQRRNRSGDVSSAGVKVGRELFAYSLERPSALRKRQT